MVSSFISTELLFIFLLQGIAALYLDAWYFALDFIGRDYGNMLKVCHTIKGYEAILGDFASDVHRNSVL